MRKLIQKLSSLEGGTVLVAGAGNGADLPALRRLGPRRVVLVEANPSQAEALAGRVDHQRGEEVWAKAISAQPMKTRELHVLNHPGFSSLNEPRKILEHFPNLREMQAVQVPACSLSDAVDALELDTEGRHVLVVDIPGQAYEVLDSTPPETLRVFASIVLRASVEPLYDGDREIREILDMMGKRGFDAQSDDPEAIFPQAAALLVANPMRIENHRLGTQLAKAQAECGSQKQVVKQLSEELLQATRGRDHATALVSRMKGELDAALAKVRSQEDLASRRDAEIAAIAKQRNDHAEVVARQKAELEKAIREAESHKKLVAERDAQVAAIAKQRNDHAEVVARQKAELEKAAQEIESQRKLVAERSARIEALTQERDEQARLASERQGLLEKASALSRERGARIIALEREQARLDRHQAWLDQEVVKAEAQVELIKDVLLREKAPWSHEEG